MLETVIGRLALPGGAKAKVRRAPRPGIGSGERELPSVSVVIPCYNYGRYLAACIASALDQDGVNVNVIAIDDASSDNSAQTLTDIAAADPRIKAIFHAENKGHIATYNEGLDLVSGDYTVLLSADDLLTPGCLARATSLMQTHPDVGMTYGFPVDIVDGPLPPARTRATSWIVWDGHSWIAHVARHGRNVLSSPEAVVRSDIVRKIGGYRDDLPHSGDLEMWLRVAAISGIGYVAGADQAYYRTHASNMHKEFNLLADMAQRLSTFDTFFTERADLLADPQQMRQSAHRALAREALGHAISAYARGVGTQELASGCLEFARDAWPDSARLRDWRTLHRLGSTESQAPGRDPQLRAREAARNARYSLGWRRRRWIGLD
jgi:glycosyltransferase involved in cell wall biosynthesis